MNILFPYPELHEMYMSPDYCLLTCPICGRQVQLVDAFQILVKGDQTATHSYSNGVAIAVTVKPQTAEK